MLSQKLFVTRFFMFFFLTTLVASLVAVYFSNNLHDAQQKIDTERDASQVLRNRSEQLDQSVSTLQLKISDQSRLSSLDYAALRDTCNLYINKYNDCVRRMMEASEAFKQYQDEVKHPFKHLFK